MISRESTSVRLAAWTEQSVPAFAPPVNSIAEAAFYQARRFFFKIHTAIAE
jgi:hypothetical protein